MVHRLYPLASSAREPFIRAQAMVGFAEIVQRFGGDPAALVAEVGLPPTVLADFDGLISFPRFCQLMELAALKLGRPTFGLDWLASSSERYAVAGPLLHLSNFVEDFEEWMDAGVNFWRTHCNGATMQKIKTDDGMVSFRCFYPYFETPPRQFTEYVMGFILLLTRRVIGIEEALATMSFQHSAPPDVTIYQTLFERPVTFDAAHSELVMPAFHLARRAKGRLRFLKPLLDQYIRARIRRMPTYDQSLSATVTIAILGTLGSHSCSIERVAASLGYTPKKLQRQLAVEGATFSHLLEEARQSAARKLLAETNAPVANIAGLLDYSTTAPFTTAFKRWTGLSPLEFRNARKMGVSITPPQQVSTAPPQQDATR
jgi:AraC-like DNA-binding protein